MSKTLLFVSTVFISDDDSTSASGASDKSRGPFSSLVRLIFGGIVKPIQALGNLLGPKRSSSSLYVGNNVDADDDLEHGGGVTHHSPTQVLKNSVENVDADDDLVVLQWCFVL